MDCPEPSSFGEFASALNARLGGTRWPASGTFELTRRCNLSCAHCYNNLPAGDAAAQRMELTRLQLDAQVRIEVELEQTPSGVVVRSYRYLTD